MAALSITYDLLLLSLYYLLLPQTYFPKLTSLYLFAFIPIHINSSYHIVTVFECR